MVRRGERRGQPWHVIMACHFSSTFPTMHDPDWSQNAHLGSWHTAQKYITWVRGSTSIVITWTRRACVNMCACVFVCVCVCVCMCVEWGVQPSTSWPGVRDRRFLSSLKEKEKQREDVGVLPFISISACSSCTLIRTIRMHFSRESQAHEPLSWGPSGRGWLRHTDPHTPKPTLSPLLKLDPRSNQRQLGVVGGN